MDQRNRHRNNRVVSKPSPSQCRLIGPNARAAAPINDRLCCATKAVSLASPLMVQQTFNILKQLRDRGVSILMIEQNARSALEMSDYGIVLELGQTRLMDRAERILGDPCIGQLFLGGAMAESAA
jgi:ABC-type lipopolysaccharide export system ATPase subunit